MARLLDNLAAEDFSSERSGVLLAEEFVLGEPASRLELVTGELVSVVDLFRAERDEDTPPLLLALGKLTIFLGLTIALTSAIVVWTGTAVVRAALGAIG